jgi:surface protein
MFQNATAFNQDISSWNLLKIAPNQFYTLVGQLVFTFTCTATTSFISPNIPLITNAYFTMTPYTISPALNSGNVLANTVYTVTCATSYNSNTSNTTEFGLSFVNLNTYANNIYNSNHTSFNYNERTRDLQITILKNIPLSKAGSQFTMVTSSSANLFALNTVPLILPNTSLAYCFEGCVMFDQSIDNWNMSNVINMSYMFALKIIESNYNLLFFPNFNQNISNWNTSNVANMSNMFSGNEQFQNGGSPLTLNAISVTNMSDMFGRQSYYDVDNDVTVYTSSPFNQPMTLTGLTVGGLIFAGWHLGAALTNANAPIQLRNSPYW